MPNKTKKLFSPLEMAKELDVSQTTVYQWTTQKGFPKHSRTVQSKKNRPSKLYDLEKVKQWRKDRAKTMAERRKRKSAEPSKAKTEISDLQKIKAQRLALQYKKELEQVIEVEKVCKVWEEVIAAALFAANQITGMVEANLPTGVDDTTRAKIRGVINEGLKNFKLEMYRGRNWKNLIE